MLRSAVGGLRIFNFEEENIQMKKILSLILVSSMLLCMMPAFGSFADAGVVQIATADDLVEFANAAASNNAVNGQLTADIDMKGVAWTPIATYSGTLDGNGKTISNLSVSVDAAGWTSAWTGNNAGLLVNFLKGYIGNLTLKDCSLTVTGDGAVNAGVVGGADRGHVSDITLNNVTIKSESNGLVGSLIGYTGWDHGIYTDVAATLTNVTIDAPGATVGVLFGRVGQSAGDDIKMTLTAVSGNVTVEASKNAVSNTTYAGELGLAADDADYDVTTNAASLNVTVTDNGAEDRIDPSTLKDGFLTIDSAAEFVAFAKAINKYGSDFMAGSTVNVTADINLADTDYVPMTNLKNVTIDFNNKTVSGIDVTTPNQYAGLIADEMTGGAIQNLTLKNGKLTTTGSFAQSGRVGTVVGRASGSTVENCTVDGVVLNVNGNTGNVGGIIGMPYDNATVSSNTVKSVDVIVANVSNEVIVNLGGIAGEPAAAVLDGNTVESFDIVANGYVRNVGGIAGCTWNNNPTLTNNTVNGITYAGAAGRLGAFIGQKQSVKAEEGNTKGASVTAPDAGSAWENGAEVIYNAVDTRKGKNVKVDTSAMTVITAVNPAVENFTPFIDGEAIQYAFDGNTTDTKMGGNVTDSTKPVVVTFTTDGATNINYYTFYTGKDSANEKGRNPNSWVLYGKNANGEWVKLSEVTGESDAYTFNGMQNVNSTPYTYKVSNPGTYAEYKFEFAANAQFQLNEIVLLDAVDEEMGGGETPPQTGDAFVAATAVAMIALAGAVIVSQKRRTAE